MKINTKLNSMKQAGRKTMGFFYFLHTLQLSSEAIQVTKPPI